MQYSCNFLSFLNPLNNRFFAASGYSVRRILTYFGAYSDNICQRSRLIRMKVAVEINFNIIFGKLEVFLEEN